VGIRTNKAAIALATTGLLTLGLAACGADETEDGSPVAESDKKIILYSGRNEELIQPLLETFEQATGITVDARYGDTAQMAAQLLEEGDRSPADVFLAQDAGALGAVTKQGMFATLSADLLDKVDPTYRAQGGEWVGVTGRSRVLAYNADLVTATDLPASVFDLTGPAWKGKVGVAPTNGSFQAFVTALRVQHGDQRAMEFLTGLAANEPQIRDGNGAIVDDVNNGRIATGLVNHYYVFQKAEEAGVEAAAMKVKLHFFPGGDTGALVNTSGVGLLAGAKDDPDAAAFVEYLLGTEAQTYFAEETYEYPMIDGIATAPGLPALESLEAPEVDLNDLDTLEATVAMIAESGLV